MRFHRRLSPEYNLRVIAPAHAAFWHPTKNGKVTPEMILPSSCVVLPWI